MAPTRSKYVKDIVRNGRAINIERAFDGKDYLDLWALVNWEEVEEKERLDAEKHEVSREPCL
jgi:large subunit ribosomal protein L41